MALLRSLRDPDAKQKLARFGITTEKAFGIPAPVLRRIARDIGTNHRLALGLWDTGVADARILATIIADPEQFSLLVMNRWARESDSWAVCDACCYGIFHRTSFAVDRVLAWSGRKEEFVKRGAFALIAALAVHDKQMPDRTFVRFLGLVKREADDERNFVRKAINWALRQIGKRNTELHRSAMETARILKTRTSASARWIGADALRELGSPAVKRRLAKREKRRGVAS